MILVTDVKLAANRNRRRHCETISAALRCAAKLPGYFSAASGPHYMTSPLGRVTNKNERPPRPEMAASAGRPDRPGGRDNDYVVPLKSRRRLGSRGRKWHFSSIGEGGLCGNSPSDVT